MTLKEKMKSEFPINTDKKSSKFANKCVRVAEEFAIGFAEWFINQDITQRGKNNFVCTNGIERSTKELLEIYKKENGL